MVAYRDCKGHLVCMADAQTGIVEIQHKDRAVRMTVPVGDSFTVTLRDTETVMTRISTNLEKKTSSSHIITEATMNLFDRIINKDLLVRRITVATCKLVRESDVKTETVAEQICGSVDICAVFSCISHIDLCSFRRI